MMLTKYMPLRELARLDPFRSLASWPMQYESILDGAGTDGSYLRFDVLDKKNSYEVVADLPGVKREDIRVFLDGHDLEVVADFNNEEDKHEDGELIRSERLHGRVRRRLTLAEEPDAKGATAAYTDGVLKISLPVSRRKEAPRKRLEVH